MRNQLPIPVINTSDEEEGLIEKGDLYQMVTKRGVGGGLKQEIKRIKRD
jgi:hypothetical protein